MGSKPSVAAAARGAAPVDKQPPRSDRLGRHPDDASHHHDHADGHSPLRHAKHAPPELQALFKHLCFQTSIRRGSDRVVNLQEVLMEELGIAKPDRKQLGEVVDMVCENPDSITEEELERICAALPDAAARLAADGSPLAALIKDVPLHLAMARAVEQVLQAKPHEAESSWLPDIHETLHPRSVGHWRGEIEVGDYPSASLGLLANLTREDVSRAVTLAHDNMVLILWNAIVRANKAHVHAHESKAPDTGHHIRYAQTQHQQNHHTGDSRDLERRIYKGYNFSSGFSLLVAPGECNQALVEKGTSQLGVLRTFIGDLPCREEDMLDAMASEHTTSVYADVAFTSSTANETTPCREWANAMRDHTPVGLQHDVAQTACDAPQEDSPRSLPPEHRDAMLDLLIACPEANGANLTRSEAMALLLLLGPMREVYNWRLAARVASSHAANPEPLMHSRRTMRGKNQSSSASLKRQVQVRDLLAEQPTRESRVMRPFEFQSEAFTNGFEVTLYCACSALLKLGRISTGSLRGPLYKGLPGASVLPDMLQSRSACHELGFMLCSAHLLRLLAEFQQDWKGTMSQWERELSLEGKENSDKQRQEENFANVNWKKARKTDKMINAVFEIEDGKHVGVDLTWVAKASGRLDEDAPENELVIFPPFCSLRTVKEAEVRVHNPFTYCGPGIAGHGLYEYCLIPLEVQAHPGMRTLEEEGSLGTRRKAAHSVLINEFLVELSSTAKQKDEWEERELDRLAAALHQPPKYFRDDANLAKGFKDLVDLRNAINIKRRTAQQIEDHVEDKSKFAVTPSLREAPSLLTIVSGLEMPAPLMQKEKDRLRWLTTFVNTAPANFFLSNTFQQKIENDFLAIPWAYLQHAAMPDVDPDGCLLPFVEATYETLNLVWAFVIESGIRHVRVRPPRNPSEPVDRNAAFSSEEWMDGMGNSAGLASLSECLWEVEAIEQILTQLSIERHTADLRHLGIDILKLAAPIVARNFKLSRALVGPAGREMSLDSMRRVLTLDLSNSDLDDESCVLLAQVLKVGSPELTTLDLRGNVLDVEGDNALAIVLRDMTSLTCLNGISIEEKDARWNLSKLTRPLNKSTSAFLTCRVDCNVEHMLELDGFAAGRWMIQGLIKDKRYMAPYVAHHLSRSQGIQHLVLSENALDARELRQIAGGMVMSEHIKTLDLSCNALRADACCAFAQVIVQHADQVQNGLRHLEMLNLSSNRIEDDGAVCLGVCLAELKALHTLDLSRNRIRDVGCTALSQGLSTLRQFKALILADNGIDDHAPGIISLSSECRDVQVHGLRPGHVLLNGRCLEINCEQAEEEDEI